MYKYDPWKTSTEQRSVSFQTSIINLSSFLNFLHLFEASTSSWQPFNKKPHFLANPSVISHPLACHGSFQTSIPFSSKSLQSSQRPPHRSLHKSCSSISWKVSMALFRIFGHGSISIQYGWEVLSCNGVGEREGGMVDGLGNMGALSMLWHSLGVVWSRFRMDRFVMQARSTLNWMRVRRWSRENGNITSGTPEAIIVVVSFFSRGFAVDTEFWAEGLGWGCGFHIMNWSLRVDFASSAFRFPAAKSAKWLKNLHIQGILRIS